MVTEISIENYKSIPKLQMSLGRINVLIGANGSGKSNILEAIALASAAANNKLDNEFLATRGIRVSEDPRHMRSAFSQEDVEKDIPIWLQDEKGILSAFVLYTTEDSYASWKNRNADYVEASEEVEARFQRAKELAEAVRHLDAGLPQHEEEAMRFTEQFRRRAAGPPELRRFLIYSPEYTALRTFAEEGQIQPLGIRGEGLFKLLRVMSAHSGLIEQVKEKLELIDWFEDFEAPGSPDGERRLRIRDRYLSQDLATFSQRSANEGFLFLLFYFCLFLSPDTPPFFAVDNVDASLNPKLCQRLVTELAALAPQHDKQAILTTHNPAILDGLNLHDDSQRLFVVSRSHDGHTRVKRVLAPEASNGQAPTRLSEAFLRGYLGGLPKGF